MPGLIMQQKSLADNGIGDDPVFFGAYISRIFRVLVKKGKRIFIKSVRTKKCVGIISRF